MSFIVSGSSSSYTPPPAGTHVARCIWMLDLGTQTDTYQGRNESARKMILGFELPNETYVRQDDEGPVPFIAHREFRTSLHKKATLRHLLEGWRGRPFTDDEVKAFDLSVLIGKECMISVIHKTSASGNTRAEIVSAARLPKGMECPKAVLPCHVFNMSEKDFDMLTFRSLPEWIRKKIEESPEFRNHQTTATAHRGGDNSSLAAAAALEDEDIPF